MANLFVVDDDLDMVDAVAEILRAGGHQVRLARNGKEGLARLEEEEPAPPAPHVSGDAT